MARCTWLAFKKQNLYNMHPKIRVEFLEYGMMVLAFNDAKYLIVGSPSYTSLQYLRDFPKKCQEMTVVFIYYVTIHLLCYHASTPGLDITHLVTISQEAILKIYNVGFFL